MFCTINSPNLLTEYKLPERRGTSVLRQLGIYQSWNIALMHLPRKFSSSNISMCKITDAECQPDKSSFAKYDQQF